MKKNIFISTIMLLFASVVTTYAQPVKLIFSKENITPWCIVPFDAKKRNPQQRAEMLQRLGFKTMAYDWRDENIQEFDEELAQLKKHGIRMTAFWWSGGLPQSSAALDASEKMQMQLDFLKRHKLKLDVWVSLSDRDLRDEPDEKKYTELARRIDILAAELKSMNCRLGLYNHGGWGGQPQNMVEVMKRVKNNNVGIIYNFHHAHEHLDLMPAAFHIMLPYLYCINLNGMNKDGPKILTLGQGTEDVRLINMITESGYNGPIGIIGHIYEEDVEIVLKRNLNGLKKLLKETGNKEALKTYE